MEVLITRAHEVRERVTYHGAPSYRIERHSGEVQCILCGYTYKLGANGYVPCHRKVEKPSSGFSGVLFRNGKYVGRTRIKRIINNG